MAIEALKPVQTAEPAEPARTTAKAASERRLSVDAAVELGPDDFALGKREIEFGFERPALPNGLGVAGLDA